jgi:hypothetical protein
MSVVHGPESPHQRMKSESAKPSSRFGSNPDPNSRDADDVRGCTRKWDFSFNYSDVARQSAGWQSNRDSAYPFINVAYADCTISLVSTFH